MAKIIKSKIDPLVLNALTDDFAQLEQCILEMEETLRYAIGGKFYQMNLIIAAEVEEIDEK